MVGGVQTEDTPRVPRRTPPESRPRGEYGRGDSRPGQGREPFHCRALPLWLMGALVLPLLVDVALAADPDAGSPKPGLADSGLPDSQQLLQRTNISGPAEDPSVFEEPGAGLKLAPLPDIEPDPRVAPVIVGSDPGAGPARVVTPAQRPGVVIKTILGLLSLMVLAYLGGHPRVLRWEERLGISQVITAGFPFVILGLIARSPVVGIINDSVLAELSPLLRLGLGWIGFVIGFRFDTRMFEGLPSGTAGFVALSTLFPFALVVGASAALLLAVTDAAPDVRDPVFLRDALILGTAAAMTAVTPSRAPASGAPASAVLRVIRLEELAGIIGLAFVAAFFRPQGASVSWQLPGTAWVLMTLGLGAAAGLLVYAILQRRTGGADFLVLTLGSISFAAGAAGYLLLSSVVVAFIAGVLLANFPGTYHARLREMLLGLERPIYLLSLLIVGALWQVTDWRGWVLMPVFMITRLVGKWLAAELAHTRTALPLSIDERRMLALSPLGPLAIAIVINAQLLYPGGSISLIVSAVIGGGVLTETFLQLENRRRRRKNGDAVSSVSGPGELSPMHGESLPERTER
jgi:hypothetical protein